MKANERRKVFKDAIDFLAEESEVGNGIQMIPVDKIVPFHNHPFRMYEGERLEDMVASVKEHGVLNPVIVQKKEDGYEMLAGHNRWNASKIVGKKTVPSIVKEGLSEEEAYVYVIETNLMQRSFTDLLPSEKAAVLAERYEKISCQGKRNDILRELAMLERKELVNLSCGHSDHKSRTRDSLGSEYELSGSSVARLLRLNKLIPEWKEMVDKRELPLTVAVKLSNYNKVDQSVIYELVKEGTFKLTSKVMDIIQNMSEEITGETIKKELEKKDLKNIEVISVKIPVALYNKYLDDFEPKERISIIENALKAWFSNAKHETS